MPNLRDIRRRIRAIKNTAQITKAMQMVAASKMRKAQLKALAGRPYADHLNHLLTGVLQGHTFDRHPLMEIRPVKRRAVIMVSSDKGLCGALSGNLAREAMGHDPATTVYITAGRKASQFVVRTRRKLVAEFTYHDTPRFAEARMISRFACDLFLKGEVDAVDILYTDYVSTLVQKPSTRRLLPVGAISRLSTGLDGDKADDGHLHPAHGTTPPGEPTEYSFEPGPEAVFAELLPHHLNFFVYQLLLEARASEHSARMVAMKNATENARDLISDLTLEYNGLRQAGITRELLEISSAALATES